MQVRYARSQAFKQMNEVYVEEVTGLGPIGVEDLFLVDPNEASMDYDLKEAEMDHCSIREKIMFDEDPSDILMEVFSEYTEESILKDAMEELKTTQVKMEREDTFDNPQANDSFENLEGLCNLEELLGISESKDKLEPDIKEEQCHEMSSIMAKFDDVFESIICEDGPSNDLIGNNIINASSSTDCIDTSCVFSDTTEVITSSNLLGKLMSHSGIPTDECSSNVNLACISRKRSPSSDAAVVPEKLHKYSETDVDECCSVYSSCVSSPEDRGATRRQKNNEASKISRANRKANQQRLFEREKELEKDNDRLRTLIEKMTEETEMLREILIDKLSGANCSQD